MEQRWADTIRDAVRQSGLSGYAICRDAQVGHATLYGFLNGKRGLSLDCGERIARAAGLELRPRRKRKER